MPTKSQISAYVPSTSRLSSYVPSRVSEAFAPNRDLDLLRWDDELDTKNPDNSKKPKFHLLIPARKPTVNLCKTLVSAAVLDYPPPTLINYGATEEEKRPGADVIRNTYKFFQGNEAHNDDMILIVEEGK